MSACTYVLLQSNRELSAQEYGYWSLRWANDNADEALRTLHTNPFADIDVISSTRSASFFLHLQLIALHAACYWVYAATLPHLNRQISTEKYTKTLQMMKIGHDDCVKEMRHADGKPHSGEVSAWFKGSFAHFYQSIGADLIERNTETDSRVVDIKLSQTAKLFIFGTAKLYHVSPEKIDSASEMALAHYIDDIPINLMLGMKETISVRTLG